MPKHIGFTIYDERGRVSCIFTERDVGNDFWIRQDNDRILLSKSQIRSLREALTEVLAEG